MDLSGFAAEVGVTDPVTIAGTGSRGGAVPGARRVTAPAGIDWIEPAEMTVCCGAATPVAELDEALNGHGQCVAIPPAGTVGGALAVGASSVRRLGYGPIRDTLLQARYVSAGGDVVTAGGPTVKNVSGFDLCRLLVGSRGTVGFIGDVILRTRPRSRHEQWFTLDHDPFGTPGEILRRLYRPVSVLWNGSQYWVLLEGDPRDVDEDAARLRLVASDKPVLPAGGRWSVPPSQLGTLTGDFVAEVGIGVVHHTEPAPRRTVDPVVDALTQRIKHRFDPTGRLNPGVSVLEPIPGQFRTIGG
jgi:FAD/FMN-containing dehydrogenase